MVKQVLKTSSVFMLLMLLMSCGESNSKVILNTEDGIDKVKNIIQDQFEQSKKVKSLSISNRTITSNEVNQITIHFVENNKNAIWFYETNMAKLFKPDPTENNKGQVKMIELNKFNLDNILIYFDEAVALVTKETDEFNNFQLGSYYIDVDQTSGALLYSFDLRATKTDNGTSFYGKRIEENLFNFSFNTNKQGVLNCRNGLDIF